MGTIHVVTGAQFGSEGKGAFASALMQNRHPGQRWHAVRVAGPNAGHTVYDQLGRKWAFRCLPVAAVVDYSARLYIAPGSELDIDVLYGETIELEQAGIRVRDRLLIDRNVTIITEDNRRAEGGNDGPMQKRIGSTGKGIGAARADRIWRTAPIARDWEQSLTDGGFNVGNVVHSLQTMVKQSDQPILVEGTQGYGLGLHGDFYPYCTSSDCRAVDFLAMAGLSPWTYDARVEVWVVARTYPIRVAGNSGPLPGETSWAALSAHTNGYITEERTTVTKKVRRVGKFDPWLVSEAMIANGHPGPVRLALMFLDYLDPEMAGVCSYDRLSPLAWDFIDDVKTACGPVAYVGTGPDTGVWLEELVTQAR